MLMVSRADGNTYQKYECFLDFLYAEKDSSTLVHSLSLSPLKPSMLQERTLDQDSHLDSRPHSEKQQLCDTGMPSSLSRPQFLLQVIHICYIYCNNKIRQQVYLCQMSRIILPSFFLLCPSFQNLICSSIFPYVLLYPKCWRSCQQAKIRRDFPFPLTVWQRN